MSFAVRCPFCKEELEVPDEMLGKIGNCPACSKEIDLEPIDAPLPVARQDPQIRRVDPVRAAAVLSGHVEEMPRVTWSWAFDAVLKISIAAAVIDGILVALLYTALALCVRRY